MTLQDFDCVFCSEPKSEEDPHTIGLEYEICLECANEQIIPLFEKAVEREFHYPPKWGNIVIEILNFWDLVSLEFFDRYMEKEKEYGTKVSERCYCSHMVLSTEADDTAPLNATDIVAGEGRQERCNAFLGTKREALSGSDRIICHRCTGVVCPCGEPLAHSDPSHQCEGSLEPVNDDAFDGLARGQSWQSCPSCGTTIELSEACNEIDCICGDKFCYCCGLSTVNEPAHFIAGGCPRWGTSQDPTAQDFDDVVWAPDTFTVREWNEAVRNAQSDERAHPTHSLPDEPLPNLDRNLRLILHRNDVRRALSELRLDLHLDEEEDVYWRHETVTLLNSVFRCLLMLIGGSSAPFTWFPDYIRDFEMHQSTIEEKMILVPPDYIASHGHLFEIVPLVVAQVQLLIQEMRGEVEWGRYMIPF